MTPRLYLNATEVGQRLKLSAGAVRQRRKRGHGLPEPDIQVGAGGPGTVYGWDPGRLAGAAPENPDDPLITTRQWAQLQGVAEGTVRDNRGAAARRRAAGDVRAWDMPEADVMRGQSPLWHLSTFRAWQAAQAALKEAHPGVWRNAKRNEDQL